MGHQAKDKPTIVVTTSHRHTLQGWVSISARLPFKMPQLTVHERAWLEANLYSATYGVLLAMWGPRLNRKRTRDTPPEDDTGLPPLPLF